MKKFILFYIFFANVLSYLSMRFIQSEAERYIQFAGAAYCCGTLGDGVAKWDCNVCKNFPGVNATVVYDRSTDANGFVAYDPNSNSIIISFSGTNPLNIANWIDDIDTVKVAYPYCSGCEVHKGFYDTYLSVQNQVRAALLMYQSDHPKVPVTVTGHSLGAALAVHCALDITLTYSISVGPMYTYGQPRVGNENFKTFYQNTVTTNYRVTHYRDPVPHLPLESFGFYHNPTEVFYNEGGVIYQICNDDGEDPDCSDQFELDTMVSDDLFYCNFDIATNYLTCEI